MVLGPDLLDGNQPEIHGIGVTMIPGDSHFQVQLQRAPDNGSGAPGTFDDLIYLPPLLATSTYVDLLPDDGAFRHYRWRHVAPGYGPSVNWSPVGRGKPRRLQGPAAGGGLISLYPIVRGRPMSDGKHALRATEPDGSTKVSDAFNGQGSVIPVASDVQLMTYNNDSGPGPTTGWVAFTWSTFNLPRPDGSNYVVAASNVLCPNPVSPTLSQVAAGALGARTYFVKTCFKRDGAIIGISGESSLAVLANNVLKVTAPTPPAGFGITGWTVFIGTSAGNNFNQGFDGTLGVDYQEDPASPAVTSGTTKASSTWSTRIVNIDLAPSTTYWWWAYYDISTDLIRMNIANVSQVSVNAKIAQQDGHVPLNSGGFSITMPGAGGTASGAKGNGNLL